MWTLPDEPYDQAYKIDSRTIPLSSIEWSSGICYNIDDEENSSQISIDSAYKLLCYERCMKSEGEKSHCCIDDPNNRISKL